MSHGAFNAKRPQRHLLPEAPPFARQLLDFLWLIKWAVRITPTASLLLAGTALVGGLATPLQLWSTKGLVDSLASHLGETAILHQALSPWVWLGLIIGAVLLQRLAGGVEPLLQARVREYVGPELQGSVMRKAGRFELMAFESQSYYDQLNRVMTGAGERGPRLVGDVVELVRSVPVVLSYCLALAFYAPALLVISLGAIVPTTVYFLMAGKINWHLLREQTRMRRLAEYYAGALGSRGTAKEVRLYGLSGHFLDRWAKLYWETRNEQRRLAFFLGLRQRGMVLFSMVVSMAGLWWVVYAGLIQATPGEYAVVFTSLVGMWSVANLAFALKRIGEGAGYASDLRAFLHLPDDLSEVPNNSTQSTNNPPDDNALRSFPDPLSDRIRFEDVWFTYPDSDEPALAGVTCEIRAGETVALVGDNGAGKSTFVKLLLGFYRPDRGRITFDGIDVTEIDLRSLRGSASGVFQHFVQYQLTLRENVGLGDPEQLENRERIAKAATWAEVDDVVGRLNEGYETLLGPDVGGTELSGGEWQRVALARAVFREAQVLALDEPSASLDPKVELAIFRHFADLAEGKTALLISHRLGIARLADRVLVMREGRVIESGPHQALVEQGGAYAELFETQARWYR